MPNKKKLYFSRPHFLSFPYSMPLFFGVIFFSFFFPLLLKVWLTHHGKLIPTHSFFFFFFEILFWFCLNFPPPGIFPLVVVVFLFFSHPPTCRCCYSFFCSFFFFLFLLCVCTQISPFLFPFLVILSSSRFTWFLSPGLHSKAVEGKIKHCKGKQRSMRLINVHKAWTKRKTTFYRKQHWKSIPLQQKKNNNEPHSFFISFCSLFFAIKSSEPTNFSLLCCISLIIYTYDQKQKSLFARKGKKRRMLFCSCRPPFFFLLPHYAHYVRACVSARKKNIKRFSIFYPTPFCINRAYNSTPNQKQKNRSIV